MKILLMDKEEGQKVGGIGIYTTRLFNYLKRSGHEVFIFRFTKNKPKDPHIIQIPLYFAEERGLLVIPTEKALTIIKNNLVRIRPDIVYLAIGGAVPIFDFFIPSICHDFHIPVAGAWHADFNHSISSYQLLAKTLFLAYLPLVKQLDLLHVFSDKLAQFYKNKGIMGKRILVLPNGVDEMFYTPGNSNFAKRHKINKGILFLGRLTLQKNPEVLIRSFLRLNTSGSKLVLVGHGDKEEDLREKYHHKNIIFTGAITDETRKLDIIRSCQICVLPSRFEGMPLAILEAMSCGLACITSDAGSNKELLGQAGIIIPSNKLSQELPAALRICLENPELVKLLGEKARQKIQTEYSQKTIFDTLVAALEKTVFDYHKFGSPKGRPIDINRIIGKRLENILTRVESLFSVD